MKIARIECLPLRAPQANAADCDGAVDTAVIRVTADNGEFGVGETDAPPNAIAALLETPSAHIWSMSIRDLLLGENPLEVERLWEKVYEGTIYHGRRGLGIMLLSAIDNALHDLRGKLLGVPAYQLLGGAARDSVTPYATLFPSMPQGRTWKEMRECSIALMNQALEAGFRAMKVEMLFYDLVDDRELVRFIHECRLIVGDGHELMIDVGYRWKNANDALWVLKRVEDARLFFVETPLHTDDLDGLARLADATTTPVAAGEFLQTRHEFRELMDRGRCDVIQPDVGRVGGLTEAMRCASMAAERGVYAIPHAWKTGLTVAATWHFGAAAPACPYTEFFDRRLFPSYLRSNLVAAEPPLAAGRWPLPDRPGLGIEMDEEVVARSLAAPPVAVAL
ncbi:MAG: mandelate racemase/muconate lactonizing enzyme family protein [Bryobacteraceae bacterium]|nr:mandelate racemase/muconate lactonizing enzyme family protein [Bryobacteraceae bacterium]